MHHVDDLAQATQKRVEVAQRVAQHLPSAWQAEVALVGSTARGLADETSDVELNVWAETLPPEADWRAWLTQGGVVNLSAVDLKPDGSRWIKGQLDAIDLEVGFQTFTEVESYFEPLISAHDLSLERIHLAEILVHHHPLHTQGWLATFKRWLSTYPEALLIHLCTEAQARWNMKYWQKLDRLAQRGEILEFRRLQTEDMILTTRLLYALNRVWEPRPKWLLNHTRSLALQPENYLQKVMEIMTASAQTSLEHQKHLLNAVILLIPEPFRFESHF